MVSESFVHTRAILGAEVIGSADNSNISSDSVHLFSPLHQSA